MFDFQPLQKSHDRGDFDCGVESLNRYLKHSARQNQTQDVGRTYVAVEPGQTRVGAYYTLSSASIEYAEYPENANLPRYPVPAILLARLAVDRQFQGQSLGRELLLHALRTAQSHAEGVAAACVVVEALDAGAEQFYRRYGFAPLNKPGRHLYLTMKKIRQLP